MKRLALTLFFCAAGATLFCGLRNATTETRHEAARRNDAWLTETQTVVRISNERTELQDRVRELRARLAAVPTDPAQERITAMIPRFGRTLTPEQREQLLAEFGFNWSSTGDFLVVSKQTLRGIRVDGVKDNQLAKVVCDVLAIMPEERAAIEATMKDVAAAYQAWAETHVQREEPSEDIVAKYTMPPDVGISQSLSNSFVNALYATLGQERGGLLKEYSLDWMVALGMARPPLVTTGTTMIVKRYGAGSQTRLGFELQQAGGSMSTDVSPWQPFPEAFKPLFPGGWRDLAAREGFELPAEFQKKGKQP